MSALTEMYPVPLNPGKSCVSQGWCIDCALVPVQHPCTADCSHFSLSTEELFLQQMHCCPGADHLLEQLLIFAFRGKIHSMLEPWTDSGGGAPPHTCFPQSPADGSAGICLASVCQGLCSLTRPLSITPARVRVALYIQVFEGNVKC